jgi:hypothetical protein
MNTKELISQEFNKDIGLIINALQAYENNLVSIYLYGGYGRNEGSWVIEDDTSVRPYNDYDIALVVNIYIKKEIIDKVKDNLKKRINIKWIDISQYTINDLKNLKTSIKNYDFKYASKLLYGEDSVKIYTPEMKQKNIGLEDIYVLYKTRIWTLIGSFDENGLTMMKKDNEMFFRNQMAKAVLAIVDCILIQNQLYECSYVKRVDKIKTCITDTELLNLSKWAINEKLFPKYKQMKKEEIEAMYNSVNRLFFKYFFIGLSKYFSVKVSSVEDIEKLVMYSPNLFLKRMIKKYIFNDKIMNIKLKLIVIQGYIAYSYPNNNSKSLSKVKDILADCFLSDLNDVDDMRLKITQLRLDI